jgi:AmmeMemoRadiSam system protein B/AmmeMemoRadiSam system protein A
MKRGLILLILPLLLLAADDIRPCLESGPWYPSDPAQLQKMLDGLFSVLPPPEKGGVVRGLIAPHAGFQYSGRCAARAYGRLAPEQGIRRVILLGASHRSEFYGACVADYGAYATPLGPVPVDTEICRALAGKRLFKSDRATMRYEHALENQIPFLQRALGGSGYKIVPVLFGSLGKKDFAAMAAAIAPYVDESTLVVASSDLTHYGKSFSYIPFESDLRTNLEKLDKGFIEPVLRSDFALTWDYHEKTGITACGFVPIGVMLRLLEKEECSASLADYYRSGDLNGDYSTSVSYAAIVFSANKTVSESPDKTIGLDRDEQRMLLELARATLRGYFSGPASPITEETRYAARPRLKENRGVFVTLRKKGELRGCIGNIVGSEPLYRGVMTNAVHAAVDDPRFPPLRNKEEAGIRIEISVMTPLQAVGDYRSIRLGRDGVVIRDGRAQAIFLPQVATETGWSLDEFLGSLCLKAGLEQDAYRASRSMQFFVFQAQVFSEGELK